MTSRRGAALLGAALVTTVLAGCRATGDFGTVTVDPPQPTTTASSGNEDETESTPQTKPPKPTKSSKPDPVQETSTPTFVGQLPPPDVRIVAIDMVNPYNQPTTCELKVELRNDGGGPANKIKMTATVVGTTSWQKIGPMPFTGPETLPAHAAATYYAQASARWKTEETLDVDVRLQVDRQDDRSGHPTYIYCPLH